MRYKEDKKVSISNHIGELRKILIKCIIFISIIALFIYILWDYFIYKIILSPLKSDFISYKILNKILSIFRYRSHVDFDLSTKLFNNNPSGQITAQISSILILSVILSFPYVIYQIWNFIKPGLTRLEKKNIKFICIYSIILFITGVIFSYIIVLPFCIKFLFEYSPFNIENKWTINNYIKIFIQLNIALGMMFLMPILTYLLTKMGIISSKFLEKYKKHALIIILILSAAITPSDIYSMILVAIPLWILYIISIYVSKIVK